MPTTPISIADLSAAGIRLHPAESTALTRELIARVLRREIAGIPSADVLRFTADGCILIEGPVAADRTVERAARLLDGLLPGFDAVPEVRVPGALRIAVARALGTLDLPAYGSLQQFSDAVERFAAPDVTGVVRSLVESWSVATGAATAASPALPAELTISDVRRARRATGLTLSEISARSRIPVSLLRELEWGYFVNWPAGQYGRTQLVRYARAAGLDDQVVVDAVWPILQEAIRARTLATPAVDGPAENLPVVETRLVKIEAGHVQGRDRRGRPARLLALLAIPALLAIAALPMIFGGRSSVDRREPPAVVASQEAPQDLPQDAPVTPSPQTPPPAPAPASAPQKIPASTAVAAADPANPVDVPGPMPAALRGDVAFSPAFATTGSAMFYHAGGEGGSALMRADTDSSGAVLRVTSIVDDSAANFHARPSPDGRMIAFDSDREGERAVYVADANGRSVRRVTGEGFAAVPSWSPDGTRLTYVRAEPGRPKVWNLWMIDLASGETTRLTSHRVGQPWGAAWFPDGERIAYSHEDRLIVRRVDGQTEQVYPSPKKGRLMRTPAVSPDGRNIIFQLYRDGAWMLNLDDGSMRRILSDPTAEEFTWSPDGRRVAYHSRKTGDWNVWMMATR